MALTGNSILTTDSELLRDPELRALVEVYAGDERRFFEDFAASFRRLTWLGNTAVMSPD